MIRTRSQRHVSERGDTVDLIVENLEEEQMFFESSHCLLLLLIIIIFINESYLVKIANEVKNR